MPIQNVSTRTKEGEQVHAAFTDDMGKALMGADYAAIEQQALAIIFRWQTPDYSVSETAQVCTFRGVGQLYVKREKQGSKMFEGFINGSRIIVPVPSMVAAKAAVQKVALRMLMAQALKRKR